MLIADDRQAVRNVLRSRLTAEMDLRVVGLAGGRKEMIELVEQLNPDIVLVDPCMPGSGWPRVIQEIQLRSPHSRIVVLSSPFDILTDAEVFKNGADGHVQKAPGAMKDILQAIRMVVAGRRYPPVRSLLPGDGLGQASGREKGT